MKRAFLVIVTLLASYLSASASLILIIDKVAKTFALSGSDSGSAVAVGDQFAVSWILDDGGLGDPNPDAPGALTYTNDVAFSTSEGSPFQTSLTYIDLGELKVPALYLSISSSTVALDIETTLGGLEAYQSYADLDGDVQVFFESSNGKALYLHEGGDFSGVQVQVVPEPSTWATGLGATALLMGVLLRRYRRRTDA